MVGFETSRIVSLLFLIVVFILFYWGLNASKEGKLNIKMRRLEALEHIDEAIGRAYEMGKEVHFTSGSGQLGTRHTATSIAGMSFLNYIAKKCADLGMKITVTAGASTMIAYMMDVLENAYTAAGKKELYNPTMVTFYGDISPRAYAIGTMGYLERVKPGANFMIGQFTTEGILIGEVGNRIGCIQIAGTASVSKLPYFYIFTDYCLMFEEIYTISAYLEQDQTQLSSIYIADRTKIALIILTIIGILTQTLGLTFLYNLLGM